MNYVLGSDAEAMAFTEAGIEYQPDGLRHAVDTESPTILLKQFSLTRSAALPFASGPTSPSTPTLLESTIYVRH